MEPLPKRPELVPTGKGTSWKLPAILVAAAVIGFVALIRFTQPAAPPPTPSPVAIVTPSPRPSASPTPSPIGAIPLEPDGATYVDGIPALIHGAAVIRVLDAAQLVVGRTVLVGGWYTTTSCHIGVGGQECPSSALSDVKPVAGSSDVGTALIALDATLDAPGARVVLATTERDPACSIQGDVQCQTRLHVVDAVWSAGSVAPAPSIDQWRLDVLTAVDRDPDNFGGAYINDADTLVVLYVNGQAKNNLEVTVHPELSVEYQQVDNSWKFLTRIAQDIESENIPGVTDVEIDTIDNKVGVYGEGVDLRAVMSLGTDYPGAVAFFGHMGASTPTPLTTP